MGILVHSPYRTVSSDNDLRKAPCNDGAVWVKGNLHTHTTRSDGPYTPQETVDAYAARGYGFLMLSDHDQITDVSGLESRGMALIPGNEISADGPHFLHVNAHRLVAPHSDRQAVIDAACADGGLAIACHPNWETSFNHCPQEQLDAWNGYTGIEIFNGVISWLPGNPLATDRWDRLLGQGRRVWGFANDDCHTASDIGIAWNVVQAEPGNISDIVGALREGRFYASTGVIIKQIRVSGRTIHIETVNAHRILAFSDYARRLGYVDARTITFTAPEDGMNRYVRFECWGAAQDMAWTQPFFIEHEAQRGSKAGKPCTRRLARA